MFVADSEIAETAFLNRQGVVVRDAMGGMDDVIGRLCLRDSKQTDDSSITSRQ